MNDLGTMLAVINPPCQMYPTLEWAIATVSAMPEQEFARRANELWPGCIRRRYDGSLIAVARPSHG